MIELTMKWKFFRCLFCWKYFLCISESLPELQMISTWDSRGKIPAKTTEVVIVCVPFVTIHFVSGKPSRATGFDNDYVKVINHAVGAANKR